ncbi:MAG: electron transport complex subunit RsxE, partial [Ruthenibacterium sp.]
IIPDKVRLPAYITVIATFVTVLQMLMNAYVPDLAEALGVFLPLIVVNCIILGRAEMFASKNAPFASALDGLGMGLGFTLTLVVMGTIRELIGAGSVFGVQLLGEGTLFGAGSFAANVEPMSIFIMPAGGFFVFGTLMALVVWIEMRTNNRIKRSVGCEGCPSKGACAAKGECKE